ncbi:MULTISPECIES: phosphatidylinositol-specific phospholipase C [Kitasatospora]|uniref:1-phosphatidylinositol phosphodiesterase n=1 Tax=Kitasatospora cystarginea TaxID=58350 RepID=A0ABN3ETH4_9ACTN
MRVDRRGFLRASLAAAAAGAVAWPTVAPASAATGTAAGATARTAPTAGFAPSDWMSALGDAVPLSRLTLPGTHDSCARYGGALTECQTLPIARQLEYGIRFLDIRCRSIDGSFAIHHGPVYQQQMFGDVLVACAAFLAAHPGETVLMRVKQEYSQVSDTDFLAVFNDYLDNRGWRGLFHLGDTLPALGAARGRVVLISDVPTLPAVGWWSSQLDLQDDWTVPTLFDRPHKYQDVVNQINRAAATGPGGPLSVNFLSGSSAGCFPTDCAAYVNPHVQDYLGSFAASHGHPPLGVLVMDFPERHAPALTSTLLNWNAQGTP